MLLKINTLLKNLTWTKKNCYIKAEIKNLPNMVNLNKNTLEYNVLLQNFCR